MVSHEGHAHIKNRIFTKLLDKIRRAWICCCTASDDESLGVFTDRRDLQCSSACTSEDSMCYCTRAVFSFTCWFFTSTLQLSPKTSECLKDIIPQKESVGWKARRSSVSQAPQLRAPASRGKPLHGAPVLMKEVTLRAPIPGGQGQGLEGSSGWQKNSNAFGRKLITAKNNWI